MADPLTRVNRKGLPWLADLRRSSQCSTTRGLISNKSILMSSKSDLLDFKRMSRMAKGSYDCWGIPSPSSGWLKSRPGPTMRTRFALSGTSFADASGVDLLKNESSVVAHVGVGSCPQSSIHKAIAVITVVVRSKVLLNPGIEDPGLFKQ